MNSFDLQWINHTWLTVKETITSIVVGLEDGFDEGTKKVGVDVGSEDGAVGSMEGCIEGTSVASNFVGWIVVGKILG
jgi:hypothetical protein